MVAPGSIASSVASRSSTASTRRAATCSNGGQPARRGSDPEIAVHELVREPRESAPRGRQTRRIEVGRQLGDERAERVDLGPHPVGPIAGREHRRVAREPRLPLADTVYHARVARQPFPLCRGHWTAPTVEHGRGREQRADVVPGEVGVGQGEDPQEAASEHRFRHRTRRGAVVRDLGEVEVLVQQPRVRVVGGVEHGHALERNAGSHRVDNAPHNGPNLVVGVGGAPDLVAGDRGDVAERGARDLGADPAQARYHLRVGRRGTGEPRDDLDGGGLRKGPEQPGRGDRPSLREKRDDRTETVPERMPAHHEIGGGNQQIVFVVPLAPELRLGGAMEAHDLPGPATLRREQVELRSVEVGEIAVRGDEGFFGRGMVGDRREQSRFTSEGAPHRRRDDGSRHGPPPVRGEHGRTEELREPVDGEERHPDDAAPRRARGAERARREPAPSGHADRIRRYEHGHRRERIDLFRARDRVAQGLRGRSPVHRWSDRDGHQRIVRRGCATCVYVASRTGTAEACVMRQTTATLEETMGLVLLVLLLALLLGGLGFVAHFLWIFAVVVAVFWLAGFAFRSGERGWYGR